MINYKLIVSDFDGTLLNDEHQIPQMVKETINRFVADGGIFVVCTGRMLSSILPRVRELGLKGIVVAYQGTVIAEIESGKIIKWGGLSEDEAFEAAVKIEELGFDMNLYNDDKLYSTLDREDKRLKLYEKITGIISNPILNGNGNKCKVSEYIRENKCKPQKITCLVSKYERESLYNKLKKELGEKFDITCSADILVEVSPINDNKGEALKFLAKYFNVPIEKTVAIGDQLNDLPMIEAAGMGVAVGNATSELKDKANFVATTNNNGAVAQIIKKYGYA